MFDKTGAESSHSPSGDMSSNMDEGLVAVASKGKELASDLDEEQCHLSRLPPELVDYIFSFLPAVDLVAVSATCHDLYQLATTDHLWLPLVQANVPGVVLSSPSPCASFRELYAAHELRWFLPRHKIWFCDRDLTGKMVVARYDPRTGHIEGYQLLAISKRTTFQHWLIPSMDEDIEDDDVVIYSFEPELALHLDRPILRFGPTRHAEEAEEHDSIAIRRIPVRDGVALVPREPASSSRSNKGAGASSRTTKTKRFRAEMPLMLDPGYRTTSPHAMFSNFVLTRPLSELALNLRLRPDFPYGNIWPPPVIPADHRVAGVRVYNMGRPPLSAEEIPSRRSEMSDRAFRIRTWLEMTRTTSRNRFRTMDDIQEAGNAMLDAGNLDNALELFNAMENLEPLLNQHNHPPGRNPISTMGLRIGEEVTTFATLDPALYTPTPRYPYRGIWVGDYSGHGCEFVLIHQPERDDDDDFDPNLLPRREGETDEDYARRKRDETVYRGSLEAIKLTGDPNVPRGEYTFVVEDLGPGGYVRTIQEAPFQDARVVKSRGHVAGTGFVNDKYIDAQLILASYDRLAQYWIGMGHISFFERVNIDRFLGV